MNWIKCSLLFFTVAIMIEYSQGIPPIFKFLSDDLKPRFKVVMDKACAPDFAKAQELTDCAKPPEKVTAILDKCGKKPKDPKKMLQRACAFLQNPDAGKGPDGKPKHKGMSECLKDPADQKIMKDFRESMKVKENQEKVISCMEEKVK